MSFIIKYILSLCCHEHRCRNCWNLSVFNSIYDCINRMKLSQLLIAYFLILMRCVDFCQDPHVPLFMILFTCGMYHYQVKQDLVIRHTPTTILRYLVIMQESFSMRTFVHLVTLVVHALIINIFNYTITGFYFTSVTPF